MTHPFDQLNKYCEIHNTPKQVMRRQKGKSVHITLECPDCVSHIGDLTQLARDIEAVFQNHLGDKPALAIAFTLPDGKVHWVTNVTRENGIKLLRAVVQKMENQ